MLEDNPARRHIVVAQSDSLLTTLDAPRRRGQGGGVDVKSGHISGITNSKYALFNMHPGRIGDGKWSHYKIVSSSKVKLSSNTSPNITPSK